MKMEDSGLTMASASPSILHSPSSILAPVFLAGPTAVGKSAVALLLAERLNGEIISVDSMQVYRGLDLGTAKPTTADRARVPHHLIDVVELDAGFDAAEFARRAEIAVKEIQSRGCVPIFCGGTGFYFKAYLEGLGEAPPADAAVRAELAATPLAELLRELEQRDPVAFAKIDRQNPRRVIRALEVIRITGKPFSQQRSDWSHAGRNPESRIQNPESSFIAFHRASADLRARINARVEAMFRAGLVAETEHLLTRGLAKNVTAMQAIGYRQVVEHLRGERGLAETIALVQTRTWQFARRQMTWYRRQAGLKWLAVASETTADNLADQLAEAYRLASLNQRP